MSVPLKLFCDKYKVRSLKFAAKFLLKSSICQLFPLFLIATAIVVMACIVILFLFNHARDTEEYTGNFFVFFKNFGLENHFLGNLNPMMHNLMQPRLTTDNIYLYDVQNRLNRPRPIPDTNRTLVF